MTDVVGGPNGDIYYSFETSFEPFSAYSRNKVDKIDLVVSVDGKPAWPLEIKLTVVPDSATSKKKKENWAPEIVIRPVSSAHAMMSIANSLLKHKNTQLKDKVFKAIKPAYNGVTDWENASEVLQSARQIHSALRDALRISEPVQRPFLMQPMWHTVGQSSELAQQCFDVFVWSDVAVLGAPMLAYDPDSRRPVTRAFREVARHVRSLCDILQGGDYDYTGIYKRMSHGNQTDKAFAMGGNQSIEFLKHKRLRSPILPLKALYDLVISGGEAELKPERRFDAAVKTHMTNHPAQS